MDPCSIIYIILGICWILYGIARWVQNEVTAWRLRREGEQRGFEVLPPKDRKR